MNATPAAGVSRDNWKGQLHQGAQPHLGGGVVTFKHKVRPAGHASAVASAKRHVSRTVAVVHVWQPCARHWLHEPPHALRCAGRQWREHRAHVGHGSEPIGTPARLEKEITLRKILSEHQKPVGGSIERGEKGGSRLAILLVLRSHWHG